MDKLLYWSDIPGLHAWAVWTVLAILLAWTVWSAWAADVRGGHYCNAVGDVWFLAMVCMFVLLARWPSLFHMVGYSIDEDQFVAAARVLQMDPVFFRSVETASSGPFNIYPLLLPSLLGIEPGLFTLRVVGVIMIGGTIVCVFYSVFELAGGSIARAATLALAIFFGGVTFWDFLHYTSELTPMFLFSIGMLGVFSIAMRSNMSAEVSIGFTILASLALSLMPLAKLQASYLGIFGGLCLLVAILTRSGLSIQLRLVWAFGACFSASIAPLLFALWMVWHGTFDYFIQSYFGNAIAYVEAGDSGSFLELFAKTIAGSSEFRVFATGWACVMIVLVVASVCLKKKPSLRAVVLGIFVVSMLAVTIYTIVSPRRSWAHYLLFAPAPMVLCLGVVARFASKRWESENKNSGATSRYARSLVVVCILIGAALPMVVLSASQPNPWVGNARVWDRLLKMPFSPVGKAIQSAAINTNGLLAVWGYNPNYYVESGLNQATRLSISTPQFNQNNLQEFFRSTYLEDLKKNKPGIFVDAAVKGQFPAMDDAERFRHELVPEVGRFVTENYDLVKVVDGVRIYRWRPSSDVRLTGGER